MNTQAFLDEIRDVLEIEEKVKENTSFSLTSLTTLSVIVFIDENFEKQVSVSELREVDSIKGLMTLIGIEKFD